MQVGLASVRHGAVKHVSHCMSETARVPPFLRFTRAPRLAAESDHLCGVGALSDAPGGRWYHAVCTWQAPKRQSHSMPIAVYHVRESPPHRRFLALTGRSSPFMRLAGHLTALSRLVRAMSAWSLGNPTWPRPGICRVVRVYGHTTTHTTMHGISTPRPPL